jgi:hypothetical protein
MLSRCPYPRLTPMCLADVYWTKVQDPAATLRRDDTRPEASEMLVDWLRDRLDAAGSQLRIEPQGNLAAMLTAAQQTKRSPD